MSLQEHRGCFESPCIYIYVYIYIYTCIYKLYSRQGYVDGTAMRSSECPFKAK